VVADRSQWTLPHVLRQRSKTHGGKVFLDFPQQNETYTFKESLEAAENIAGNLLSICASGDRVLIMAPNSSAVVLSWFGINVAGLVHVPLNVAYRGSFLEHQVSLTSPSVAIVAADYVPRFIESATACGTITHFFVIGDVPAVDGAIKALSANRMAAAPFGDLLDPCPGELPRLVASQLANIYFTSGTTGLSKGVMMSFSQVHLFGEEIAAITQLGEDDVYMNSAPMFHGNTPFHALTPCLITGARLVLYEKFSPSSWLAWARESKATHTNLVGVMMEWVCAQQPTALDADQSLRCVNAVPRPPELVVDFQERFGVESVVEVYGSTESTLPIVTPAGQEPPRGACGILVDEYFDVRIVDPDTDEEVPNGEMGELLVRPRYPWTTSLGYFNMPDKTAEAFRNLWFHTGDGLRRDDDGWFYFVDRLKDAIRRRGENISSFELEQALAVHPAIVECAVVAVPADQPGSEDEVFAFLVLADGVAFNEGEIWRWCDDHLPVFMVPRYLSDIDVLPKTPSERVKKVELRKLAQSAPRVDRLAQGAA
jgi:crotonobetaine/carnitine-CoA ligase